MSISRKLAELALDCSYQDLPEDVIHQTKRLILDTLGCAIGAYPSETNKIIQKYLDESGGTKESTVIGSGFKTTCDKAAFANGALVRYLDFNDTAFIIQGDKYRTGYHPSEVIPPILSVGERERVSGKEIIAAIVLGYDLSLSFLEAVVGAGMEKKGWNGDTRGAYIVPILAGKLLGLKEEQIENAVGISGSCNAVLGILDSAEEEYTMTKNIRFPGMASNGIIAALLAQKGFTGPSRVIEGQSGFIEAIMSGDYDLKQLTNFKGKYTIRDSCIKSVIADFSSHGHITATKALAKTYDIKPEDVEEIKITTSVRCAEHTGDDAKKYPTNKETADHSAYYLSAIAIIDRDVGPAQFTPEKYNDPKVRELIDKVVLKGDPTLDRKRPAGISEIVTKNGQTYRQEIDYPRGHARNPMTDQEVIDKFESMASEYMNKEQIDKVVDIVFNLEKLRDVGDLSRAMIFNG